MAEDTKGIVDETIEEVPEATIEKISARADVREGVVKAVSGLKKYIEVPQGRMKAYQLEIRNIVDSVAFQNEVQYIIDGCLVDIAMNAESFDEVRDLRMKIAVLQDLRDRLTEMAASPQVKNADFDPNAPV